MVNNFSLISNSGLWGIQPLTFLKDNLTGLVYQHSGSMQNGHAADSVTSNKAIIYDSFINQIHVCMYA